MKKIFHRKPEKHISGEEKDLHKLKREEIVEMLLDLSHENAQLQTENETLRKDSSDSSEPASPAGESAAGENLPDAEQISQELKRIRHRKEYHRMLRNTIYVILVVAAAAVLVATLFLPVLQVTGGSMEPTLQSGQLVLAVKTTDLKCGDIIAFYYNNKLLLKRVIALAGDQVDIRDDGTVYVNGKELAESYLSEKSIGQTDLDYPYQVPDGKVFVMGDHRATSLDSRMSSIGCISGELIVGRVLFRVWPLTAIGKIQ